MNECNNKPVSNSHLLLISFKMTADSFYILLISFCCFKIFKNTCEGEREVSRPKIHAVVCSVKVHCHLGLFNFKLRLRLYHLNKLSDCYIRLIIQQHIIMISGLRTDQYFRIGLLYYGSSCLKCDLRQTLVHSRLFRSNFKDR